MDEAESRSTPADAPARAGTLADLGPPEPAHHGEFPTNRVAQSGAHTLWRRRLRHDIRHELGTIIMLASAVAVAEDVGDTSRARIEQLLGETRWLDHLLRRLDEDDPEGEDANRPPPNPDRIRVDDLTAEVVTGMRLATSHEVCFAGDEAWAHIDPVALWRAVRNVLDNACRVADGHVDVRVESDQGWVAVQVDDDGPGFGGTETRPDGPARRGLASLGLGIVHDLVSGYGGSLEIRTCEMGGARVRILLPAAPPPDRRHPGRGHTGGGSAHPSGPSQDAHADDWRRHP